VQKKDCTTITKGTFLPNSGNGLCAAKADFVKRRSAAIGKT